MALTSKPKTTTAHRKRSGQHHRQSKHYLKAYWPYLPMLMIISLGLILNGWWSAHNVLGSQVNFSSGSLLASTNADRALDNEAPLTIDAQLTAAAQAKANDMVARDYWSHNTPDGRTPWTFVTGAGYSYQAAGENLAYGFNNAPAVVIGWMNSAEHRANVLNASYQNVGFGVASSNNYQGKGPETVVVAEYGQPATVAGSISFSVPPATGSTSAVDQVSPNNELAAQPVSRLTLLTGGQAPWSVFALSLVASASVLVFILRHGLRFKKLVLEGEVFVSRHPVLDILVVVVFVSGFLLTRSAGIIR